MGLFYFTDPKTSMVYELSATTNITVKESATTTSYPVEDGSSVVDNCYLENRIISFQGVITDIRVYGQDEARARSVDTWIQQIRGLRKSKTLLSVDVHTLQQIPNCIITTFDISRGKSHGLSGWDCTLVFKEITVSERAKLTEVKIPLEEVKDKVVVKSGSGDSSTKEVEITTTFGLDGVNGLIKVATPTGGN